MLFRDYAFLGYGAAVLTLLSNLPWLNRLTKKTCTFLKSLNDVRWSDFRFFLALRIKITDENFLGSSAYDDNYTSDLYLDRWHRTYLQTLRSKVKMLPHPRWRHWTKRFPSMEF